MSPKSRFKDSVKITGPELLAKVNLVIFDLDGIIFHSGKVAVADLKNRLITEVGSGVDLNFTEADIENFGQLAMWAEKRGYPKEKLNGLEMALWDSVQNLSRAEAIEGAKDLVQSVAGSTKIEFHTSRPVGAKTLTVKMLVEKFEVDSSLLAIRGNENEDRSLFKPKNAAKKAKRHGPVLVVEDIPDNARKILEYADKERVEVWSLLIPYAKIDVPDDLLMHPRLVCLRRNSESQSVERAVRYLKGEPI